MTKRNTKEQILQGGKGASTTTSAATGTTAPSTPLAQNRVPSLGAANPELTPVKDLTQPATSVGGNWAGTQPQQTKAVPKSQNGLPALTEEQLEKEKNREQPPQTPTNKLRVPLRDTAPTTVPGPKEMPKMPIAEKYGVMRPNMWVYDQLIKEHEKEDEQDQARRRRDALFNAIADGVSSLSNLYFTTQGAPSATSSKSLVAANDEGYDKRKKERNERFEKRMRLLKDKQSEYYKNLDMKMREERLAADNRYRQDRIAAENKRTDAMNKYRIDETERHKAKDAAEAKRKDAAEKRKDDEAAGKKKERENRMANNNKKTAYYGQNVANQIQNRNAGTAERSRHNRAMESKSDKKKKKRPRGQGVDLSDGNPYGL